jgi:alpha-tubulin suppressor-like RCC1 family protein
VDVSGLTTGAAGVTAGGYHTCALLSSGGVKCWGYNKYGQLGDGSKNDRKTPGQVSGLLSGTVSVSAGGYHTCALSNSASVSCWGVNSSGQLGDGTNDNRVAPNPVEGLFAGADSISAGYLHTCAAMLSGGGVCWGDNSVGQLGDGSAWKAAPVEVLGLQ